ncbi:DUF3667 domain-containing protein [Portibacter marinus]|uniref:DUF3667 domain-containing protein n=1 Tax=Portibacter marinus TaxID=2898660 RepID=UPI001F3904ED|nr:DUF3667 domain-containing protein [Portibacter marinus]
MSETTQNICPNCSTENPPGYNYCISCGQKNRPLKITFFEFIKEFFNIVLNLENKFWRTLGYVFVPGKLTQLFFEGKRASFYHPLRLYIVCVIIFFTVISLLKLDNVIKFDNDTLNLGQRYNNKKVVYDQKPILGATLDSLREIYTNTQQRALLDSLDKELYLVHRSDTIYLNSSIGKDSNTFKFISNTIQYTNEEIYNGDIDTVVANKNLNNFIDRIAFRQYIKAARDLNSLNNFIFANLTWLFLAVIPIFSLILKVFYIRRKRYYMEHFVFLLHLFSALILFSAIILGILVPLEYNQTIAGLMAMIGLLFPYFAFKNYYKQGNIKTIIKYILIGIVFFVVFLVTFLLFVVITAALF